MYIVFTLSRVVWPEEASNSDKIEFQIKHLMFRIMTQLVLVTFKKY